MEHKQGSEKVTMTDDTSIPFVKPLTLADVPEIRRTRLILLILTTICFGIAVAIAITIFFESTTENYLVQGYKICGGEIFILLFGFGLVVTYKYHLPGITAFATIVFVVVFAAGLAFVRIVSGTYMLVGVRNKRSAAIHLIVFFDVMVIIFSFALKLTLLIAANQHLIPGGL